MEPLKQHLGNRRSGLRKDNTQAANETIAAKRKLYTASSARQIRDLAQSPAWTARRRS